MITVRAMRPGERPRAEALWESVGPYRPEDAPEVEAMRERARRAMAAGDRRWKRSEDPVPGDSPPTRSAHWVAVVPSGRGGDRIVGTCQVVGPTHLSQMPAEVHLRREWRLRDGVAELSHLRVTDDVWRGGVGTRLVEAAVDWCRRHGFSTLVLSTTTPQRPAIALYAKLGFREMGRTFLGSYELVWLSLDLADGSGSPGPRGVGRSG